MIRTILVDDELNALNFTANALSKYCSDVEIIGKVQSVADAELLIQSTHFDLLLLDIELIDGTAFDLLNRLSVKSFEIIFITAYNQHAIKAFKYNAIDYILKPVNIKELISAIDKVRIRLNSTMSRTIDYKFLLESMKSQSIAKLAIHSLNETVFVSLEEINRFEAYGNYSRVILKDGSQIISSKTLKDYEQILDEDIFFRVHHSHIINIHYLKKYIRKDGYTALMKDGLSIPVATRRREAFEHFMKIHFTNIS
jgi:two-component system, LytTR family, response regulator